MKKVLSVILAIMMIATVVPMAFAAEECEHVFNEETLVRPTIKSEGTFVCSACGESVAVKLADYSNFNPAYSIITAAETSIYSSEEASYEIMSKLDRWFSEIVDYMEKSGIDSLFQMTEYEQEHVDALTEILNKDVLPLEEVVFYGIEIGYAVTLVTHYEAYYGEEIYEIPSDASYIAFENLGSEFGAIQQKVLEDPTSVTQEEYDAVAEKAIAFFTNIISCAEGKHIYENATDNGDGTHSADCTFCDAEGITEAHTWGEYTENADGTKTANCISCEATDTIVPENPDDDEDIDTPETPDNDENTEEEIPFDELSLYEKLVDIIKNFIELLRKFLESIFA